MSVSGEGSSIESALEVKPTASTGNGEEASSTPSDEEGQDNRKALNYGKEALKKVGKLEEQVAEANRMNQQLVERLLQTPSAPSEKPAAPVTPPYSQAELQAALESQDTGQWSQMFEANAKFQQEQLAERIRADVLSQVATDKEGDKLKSHLMKSLGLVNSDSEYAQAIAKEASRLKREFPTMDDAAAEVVAAGTIYRQAAVGDLEFEDLRRESVETRKETTVDRPKGHVVEPTYDMDAPNRGLTPEMVKKLHKFRLGHVLERSKDPVSEEAKRRVIDDILGHEYKVQKRRAAGQ